MASYMPGQGAGFDQPEPEAQQPATPAPPAEPAAPGWTTPPPPNPSPGGAIPGWATAPQQPAMPQGGQGQWGGSAPQPQSPTQWGAAPQQPASQPPATTQWGAAPARPATQPPAAAHWGSASSQPDAKPEAAEQPQAAAQWGAGPAQPASQPQAPAQSQAPAWGAAPQQSAPQPGWSAAPPPQAPVPQAPVPPPGWNSAPPPQGPAPQPGWGGPGQPQPAYPSYGAPPPVKSGSNGCLKACLVVGVILVVLAIIVVIALTALGASFFGGLGFDSSGNLKDCSIVTSAQLQTALGPDTEAHPLSGLANSTIGATLDKRVLPNADNCYIVSGASDSSSQVSGGYGRIAKYSGGDAASVFNTERSSAQSGQYFAVDVPNAGDQAFCTGWSDRYPATGALVRKGNDLVYVSLLIGSDFGNLNLNQPSSDTGIPYSPDACTQAVSIAELALH